MNDGLSAAKLPRPGDMIAGKYVVERLLGQGGMGAVFAARHVKLAKPVAIKIMFGDAGNPEASHRFINEGRAAANIQNEHVVRVDDVDEEHGYAYMVLELLDGEDLGQVLERERRVPAGRAADYVLQALRGVHQAHAIGIVHRDLKPSNLFLARRKDGTVVVKVLDFGISKAQGSSALLQSPSALTSTKAMLGSPLYMSPEQLRSSKNVDHRADIWAAGIILYELVTGQLPFVGDNLGELFAAILEQEPPRPSLHVPDLPPELERIILRCLERRPENRFQDAAALMQALAPLVDRRHGEALPAIPSSGAHVEPPRSEPLMTPRTSPGAITGGAVPSTRGATMALGGPMSSQPVGWHTTGGTTTGIPGVATTSRSTAILAGVFAALAVVGASGIVYWVQKHGAGNPPVVASEPPPTPAPVPSASASTVPSVVPTPTPTPTPLPAASVTPTPTVTARPTAVTRPTAPPPPTAPPTATHVSPLQNTR